MTVEIINFQKAVEKAFKGAWQLPNFQRDLKWKVKQNILLFDSLRTNYPVGTFLSAEEGSLKSFRPFKFSIEEKKQDKVDRLLLDGQQRLTAGIQLFYSDKNAKSQKTFYFIDLNKLEQLLEDYKANTKHFDISDDEHIEEFGEELDADSGYLIHRSNVKNPNHLFLKKGFVCTALLRKNNESSWDTHKTEYLSKYPDKKRLIEIFTILFRGKDFDPQVPNIVVDSKDPKVLTRIFSTLNNTGTSLTPFEITVSEMYGQGVDLREEIDAQKNGKLFYQKIDKDSCMILQMCLLLSGTKVSHKKTNLPKTMTRVIWDNNKTAAIESIEKMAKFLSEHMGLGLELNANYIPYDTALLPLAHLFSNYDQTELDSKTTTIFHKIVKMYFVTSALKLHYTEGATAKQSSDKDTLIEAVNKKDTALVKNIFNDKSFSGLEGVTLSGAKGRVLLCIQNAENLKDVLTGENVTLSKNHEIHHIFPKKMFKDWKTSNISQNHIANLMITDPDTNNDFSGSDPREHVKMAASKNGNFKACYNSHFINEKALEILEKDNKTLEDYYRFINLRSQDLIRHIENVYEVQMSAVLNNEEAEIDPEEAAD